MGARSIFLWALLIAAGCGELAELPTDPGGPPEPPPDPTATLTRIQSQIFTPTCALAGCHGAAPQLELVLRAGQSYGNLVNRPSMQFPSLNRVTPGDPDNSYLYRKITGRNITGDRMPQASPPLSDQNIQLIRDWIRRGAPND